MPVAIATNILTARLVGALYTEAMLLADETRFYLDGQGVADRALLDPVRRVQFACESLNGTTRLMQAIAWLLSRRAPMARDDDEAIGGRPLTLGAAPVSDDAALAVLPDEARRLIDAGIDLYERIRRLDQGADVVPAIASPARSLMQRLERSF